MQIHYNKMSLRFTGDMDPFTNPGHCGIPTTGKERKEILVVENHLRRSGHHRGIQKDTPTCFKLAELSSTSSSNNPLLSKFQYIPQIIKQF